ncbi:ribulose-bisphosphate carboxylase large subunit family protein [Sphingomonas cannabina]|uniref:ribulose-bisphosphate carboxylase large subunit family protein n=1 Tax=Sphingomonas cannabina TaxID=2899123 RepID=UPI001F3773B5|nr:ribulose-bisphosphate carboxylase large subunit family protein [Sphingomonas cannabina]UIJ45239.1 ribulose-bisphosphate carboxylase large subunit family protein [Sphingomonas cannabina]
MTNRVYATYWIETAFPLAQAAETMAGEQSTGTFVRVPGETDALREAHAAVVESIEELEDAAAPSLPGSGLPKGGGDGRRRTARVTLSWPVHNFGPSLPNLLATVAGNLSELKAFSGLKLLDLRLPPVFLDRYQGPQFGVPGTRELADVWDRPMIGTIIKPSVGLDPEATAAQVAGLLDAGIDFIKDDELQADGPACPFEARISAVMRVINDHAQRTGKKAMYAANLTGDVDEMLRRHDHVLAEGGTCVMASMNSIGLPAMKMLRAHSQLPIHGHRNGWGMLGRSPAIGMSYVAFQKLWRLAGIDHTHVNGIDNKFCEANESVIASARECLTPMFDPPHPGCEIMPVFSSGQSAKQAHATYEALGSTDLIFAAGGGILAHPGGPAAGVTALRQAWDAAVAGVPLDEASRQAPELQAALGAFAG